MKAGPFVLNRIYKGDTLALTKRLPAGSIHCAICSPPYWQQRDYGEAGQWGLEATPEEYTEHLVEYGRELRRALRDDGTWWLNLGDSFFNHSPRRSSTSQAFERKFTGGLIRDGMRKRCAGHAYLKIKDLTGVPWKTAIALQQDGWWLRQAIVWYKPNATPESVMDRPTSAHEYVFLLAKSKHYFYDSAAVKEPCQSGPADLRKMRLKKAALSSKYDRPDIRAAGTRLNRARSVGDPSGRNKRSVWIVPTIGYPGKHYASWPRTLVRPMILAGTSAKGCCPECGAPLERIKGRGWRPTCKCRRLDVRPCIVFDPFAGSGTTGVEAIHLGRAFIGFDLSGGEVDHGGWSPNDRLRAAEKGKPEPWVAHWKRVE